MQTARTGRKRRIANWQFAIREMQHCGALLTRARGVQSLKPFATTLHDVCGSVGWQQNPPFDQWDLTVLRVTRETRAVQLVTACARWWCIPIAPKPTHYPPRHPLHVCGQLDGLPIIISPRTKPHFAQLQSPIGAVKASRRLLWAK